MVSTRVGKGKVNIYTIQITSGKKITIKETETKRLDKQYKYMKALISFSMKKTIMARLIDAIEQSFSTHLLPLPQKQRMMLRK